ncbi:NYN domain-containing protein [Corynebacterium sp.]|uniref:NYN domain-containing protein n=1 Tax=Corynebacterium sp. TaxID=1720 RepID=UPI0026DCB9E7|nr:NYN domain-containing protein [Corynebacterium sp.]MDO5033198.1 NYN domain-containing protein [Corynebacterium sp.]
MSGTYLLIWDAPNMDMGLGSILGGRPTAAHRPRFDAIGRWVAELAADNDAEPEAAVFTNVSPGSADVIRPWVEAIRNVGFAVFAKPKLHDDDDVDPDMLAHIEASRDHLSGLIVASADGQNFQATLEELASEGLPVCVLGFHEHASWAVTHPEIEFVDLEDIEGVFREPLPRVNLDNLPEGGAWLQPFRSLKALLER